MLVSSAPPVAGRTWQLGVDAAHRRLMTGAAGSRRTEESVDGRRSPCATGVWQEGPVEIGRRRPPRRRGYPFGGLPSLLVAHAAS
jgi:hypothetical protein